MTMAESADSSSETDTKTDTEKKDKRSGELELIDESGIFKDMYLKDPTVQDRIQETLDSEELKALMAKAKKGGKSLDLLDDVVKEEPVPLSLFQRLKKSLRLFKTEPEYNSKDAYLIYLKSAYRFMMIPLEERPSLLYRIFYAENSSKWKPSDEDARELLEKFYLETRLIKDLPDKDWKKIRRSKDPEIVLNKVLYGIDFKPEFQQFLQRIPWIISRDKYGAPALDLIFWRAPGTDVPQKPVAVDDEFIDSLVEGVHDNQAYAKIEVDDEFVDLKSRKQIMAQLKKDERVLIDSYVGVSKIERDFILHKRLILWRNPGFERYEKESKAGKMRSAKPMPYLVLLQERAQQLEIPFVTTVSPEPRLRPRRIQPQADGKS